MKTPIRILIATGNAHKAGEIREILGGMAIEWKTTDDWPAFTEVEENGITYEENAAMKARAWQERTGVWTLADDSGLEVDALGGRPGLRSARYGRNDAERIAKLLGELAAVPAEKRTARFVCAACLCGPGGTMHRTRGVLEGRIGFDHRGNGGFGYDPVFVPEGFDGRHLAELTVETKNRISHRARAMTALKGTLEGLTQTD